jgi:acetyl-CoA C-acetyltransferase
VSIIEDSAAGAFDLHVNRKDWNRVCGSGAQETVSAPQEILMGLVDTAVAGGMENMDAARSDTA